MTPEERERDIAWLMKMLERGDDSIVSAGGPPHRFWVPGKADAPADQAPPPAADPAPAPIPDVTRAG